MSIQHPVKYLGGLYSGREQGEKIDLLKKVIFMTGTCSYFAKELRLLTVFLFKKGKEKTDYSPTLI